MSQEVSGVNRNGNEVLTLGISLYEVGEKDSS